MTTMINAPVAPVLKTVTVKASLEHAFKVFTEGFDTWWPRSHSVVTGPMEKALMEPFVGGRCYQRGVDGSECNWARVIAWEPPHRFVLAWQLNADWKYDPDMSKASEVEVRFSSVPGGGTRVELEHRYFERHGARGVDIRTGVDSKDGWGGLLEIFRNEAEKT